MQALEDSHHNEHRAEYIYSPGVIEGNVEGESCKCGRFPEVEFEFESSSPESDSDGNLFVLSIFYDDIVGRVLNNSKLTCCSSY